MTVTFDTTTRGDIKERVKTIYDRGGKAQFPVESLSGKDVKPHSILEPYRGLSAQAVVRSLYSQDGKGILTKRQAFLNANGEFDSFISTFCDGDENCKEPVRTNPPSFKQDNHYNSSLNALQHAQLSVIKRLEKKSKDNILEMSQLLFTLREKINRTNARITPRDAAVQKLRKINLDRFKSYRKQTALYIKEIQEYDKTLHLLSRFSGRVDKLCKRVLTSHTRV